MATSEEIQTKFNEIKKIPYPQGLNRNNYPNYIKEMNIAFNRLKDIYYKTDKSEECNKFIIKETIEALNELKPTEGFSNAYTLKEFIDGMENKGGLNYTLKIKDIFNDISDSTKLSNIIENQTELFSTIPPIFIEPKTITIKKDEPLNNNIKEHHDNYREKVSEHNAKLTAKRLKTYCIILIKIIIQTLKNETLEIIDPNNLTTSIIDDDDVKATGGTRKKLPKKTRKHKKRTIRKPKKKPSSRKQKTPKRRNRALTLDM